MRTFSAGRAKTASYAVDRQQQIYLKCFHCLSGLAVTKTAQKFNLGAIDLIDRRQTMREAGAVVWKPLANLPLPRHAQDHVACEPELLLDQGKNDVAVRRVGNKARVFAGNFQIDEAQGFLDFAKDQPEETRFDEHTPQKRFATLLSDGEKTRYSAPRSIPAGDRVPVLRPGEHKRDSSQIA